jgi:hypothetical protein
MANEFHATFTSGTTINISDTLVIAFDKPAEADPVVVTLSEVDAWVSNGANVVEIGKSPAVLIAEFTGKIVGGRFTGTQTKPSPASTGSPALKVRFDGEPAASFHSLTIPSATRANEEGIFEVQLKVTGTVAKKAGSYTAPSPVFVRNFKSGRPVISFITGSGGGYFLAARDFMEAYADATLSRDNVLDIREFVRTQSDPRGFGPWGEVNIVDHGNALEWVIKLVSADTASRHLRRWHVAEAAALPQFKTPIPSLDKDSTVVIRGCAIGKDQGLVDEIRNLFGGVCKVLAPKHLQEYDSRGGTAREGFFEFFHFYSTTGPANGPATLPTDADCRTALKAKFPSPVPPISDADWLTFLGRRALNRDGFRASNAAGTDDRSETITWREARTVTHAPGRRADAVAAANAVDWRGDAESNFNSADQKLNLETEFSEWHFVEGALEEKAVKGGTRFSRMYTGTRIRIEIRRELRDAKGTPIKPDLTNPDHYGSSP